MSPLTVLLLLLQVINACVPPRSYWPVALSSVAVTQQLSCVVLAAVVPLHLHAGRLSAGMLLAMCGLLLAAGEAQDCEARAAGRRGGRAREGHVTYEMMN